MFTSSHNMRMNVTKFHGGGKILTSEKWGMGRLWVTQKLEGRYRGKFKEVNSRSYYDEETSSKCFMDTVKVHL